MVYLVIVFCLRAHDLQLHIRDKRERFLKYKMSFLDNRKKFIFPKGLTHAFNQNIYIFSLLVFGQNMTRNNV